MPTPRERQVLAGLARGWTIREIAWELYISPKTVEKHCARIKEKLDLANMHQLIVYAVNQQWEERLMQAFEDLKVAVNQIAATVNDVVVKVDQILAELAVLRDGPSAAEVQALVDQLAAEKAKLDALLPAG